MLLHPKENGGVIPAIFTITGYNEVIMELAVYLVILPLDLLRMMA